jgi:hypothetical protein
MSTPLRQEIEKALADLQVQQDHIRTASQRLAKVTGSATSKDRTIEATVDSQGRLEAIKLKGTGYRKLAPAEFAARIVDTVRSAQEHAGRQAGDALTGVLPTGLDMGGGGGTGVPFGDGLDLDGIFEAAARAVQEPLFPERTPGRPKGGGHA